MPFAFSRCLSEAPTLPSSTALRLRLGAEQEGHVVDLEGRLDLGDHRIGDDAHVDGAEPHAVHQRAFVADGAVGVELHLDAVADAVGQRLLEGAGADGIGVLRAVAAGPADAEDGLALRAQDGGREAHGEGGGAEAAAAEGGHRIVSPMAGLAPAPGADDTASCRRNKPLPPINRP